MGTQRYSNFKDGGWSLKTPFPVLVTTRWKNSIYYIYMFLNVYITHIFYINFCALF